MNRQTSTLPDEPTGSLWAFASVVYRRSGVSEACLYLQDRCGADIPLMLTVLFAASRGITPNRSRMGQLDALCQEWRRQVVVPLREARRWIKGGNWMQRQEAVPALREGIKALELESERIQLMALEAEIVSWGVPERPPATTNYRRALFQLLQFCDADLGRDAESADVENAVATIADAVRDETGRADI